MVNSGLLKHKVIGNGYPVVFLHGFLESKEMWDYFSFENEFQCILVDLPGHGASNYFSEALSSMSKMAAEIQKILLSLGITKCAVVGHSMGGYVGLELLKMNTHIEKLVLLNSNFWQDSDLKKEDRKRVAEIVKLNKNLFLYEAIPNLFNHPDQYDSDIKTIISIAKNMDEKAIGLVSLAMAQRAGFEKYLVQFSKKLLIIQGKHDTIVPMDKMKNDLKVFPEISIKYVDSGHMAHIEKTLKSKKIIIDFLKQKTETY